MINVNINNYFDVVRLLKRLEKFIYLEIRQEPNKGVRAAKIFQVSNTIRQANNNLLDNLVELNNVKQKIESDLREAKKVEDKERIFILSKELLNIRTKILQAKHGEASLKRWARRRRITF